MPCISSSYLQQFTQILQMASFSIVSMHIKFIPTREMQNAAFDTASNDVHHVATSESTHIDIKEVWDILLFTYEEKRTFSHPHTVGHMIFALLTVLSLLENTPIVTMTCAFVICFQIEVKGNVGCVGVYHCLRDRSVLYDLLTTLTEHRWGLV